MIMKTTMHNLMIGLAASLLLVASAGATTVSLDTSYFDLGGSLTFVPNLNLSCGTDADCGTLAPSHGGQTVGWSYTISNNTSYWFVADSLTAVNSFDPLTQTYTSTPTYTPHAFNSDYDVANNLLFDFPVIDPTTVAGQTYNGHYEGNTWVSATTGLFEITWQHNVPFDTHEAGFFLLSGSFYHDDPFSAGFGGGNYAGAFNIATPFDASAPEPFSILLFGTGFGVALAAKRRTKRTMPG